MVVGNAVRESQLDALAERFDRVEVLTPATDCGVCVRKVLLWRRSASDSLRLVRVAQLVEGE